MSFESENPHVRGLLNAAQFAERWDRGCPCAVRFFAFDRARTTTLLGLDQERDVRGMKTVNIPQQLLDAG